MTNHSDNSRRPEGSAGTRTLITAAAAITVLAGAAAVQAEPAAAQRDVTTALKDACQESFRAIRASYRAPVAWQIRAALAGGACGATAGWYLGTKNVNFICSMSHRPAWMGGGVARFVVRVVTSGRHDRC